VKPPSANRAAGRPRRNGRTSLIPVNILQCSLVTGPFAVAVLLAAAVSTRVELIDEIVRIPERDWRYVQVALKQRPGMVSADYAVQGGGTQVRLALVPREDLEQLPGDLSEGALAATAAASSGHLAYPVPLRGVYAIVIDNRDSVRPAAVHLRAFLEFGAGARPQVTRLSPQRQFGVIAISFVVFFAIVTYSARRLLRGIRR
jgi:hypothetical protein